MISDAALADLCLASYDPAVRWDLWSSANGVWVAIKRMGDVDAVCFRGSVTTEDWIRDLRAVPETTDHSELGPVHAGFFEGMEMTTARVLAALRPEAELAVMGHSLGAARAWLFAALIQHDHPVSRICVFGSPRPGFPPLRAALARISAVSYRNATPVGHDRITDLPVSFPELPWLEPRALTDVCAPPAPDDHGAFRFHHMPLYRSGLGSA